MNEQDHTNPVDEFDLAKFDEEYAAAEVEKREPVPDGKYQVAIEKAELTRAKTSGKPMLKWTLRILSGPHVGRCLWRNNLIVTSDNIKWLKTDLSRCGIEIEKLSDLPANLDCLLDVTLEVLKRTRGNNENVFLNRRIEIADIEGGYEAAASDARRQI